MSQYPEEKTLNPGGELAALLPLQGHRVNKDMRTKQDREGRRITFQLRVKILESIPVSSPTRPSSPEQENDSMRNRLPSVLIPVARVWQYVPLAPVSCAPGLILLGGVHAEESKGDEACESFRGMHRFLFLL